MPFRIPQVVYQLRSGNHVKVGSGYEQLTAYMATLGRKKDVLASSQDLGAGVQRAKANAAK